MLQDRSSSALLHACSVDKVTYLHGQEAETLSVQHQCEHDEDQGNVCAQNAQRRYADEVAEERLLTH